MGSAQLNFFSFSGVYAFLMMSSAHLAAYLRIYALFLSCCPKSARMQFSAYGQWIRVTWIFYFSGTKWITIFWDIFLLLKAVEDDRKVSSLN